MPPSSLTVPLVMDLAPLIVRLPADPTSNVWLLLVIEMVLAAVAVPENNSVEVDPEWIAKLGPLATEPVRFRTPLLAVIVPPVPLMDLVTVPDPVRLPPLPMVRAPAPPSVPPSSLILPLVMLSAAVMLRLPSAPTSSVWLALLIVIAAADVAVPSILRSELGCVVLIASVRPLTVPVRSSVPPIAVIVPALDILIATVPTPEMLVFAATCPCR